MKYLFTLLLAGISFVMFSQEFLVESKKWNDLYTHYATCNCTMMETHSYFLEGDTTIQEKSYKILYDSIFSRNAYSDRIELAKKGFIREDINEEEIYYIENGLTSEKKIYDFKYDADSSLSVGSYTYTVFATDSVEVMGIKRKILSVSDGSRDFSWISGIGSDRGLFYFQFEEALLLCAEESDELIYENTENYECIFFDYISSINQTEGRPFNLYPNPTLNELTISGDVIIENIEIYNPVGILIQSYQPERSEIRLNIENYKTGIYFVKINSEVFQLIKK